MFTIINKIIWKWISLPEKFYLFGLVMNILNTRLFKIKRNCNEINEILLYGSEKKKYMEHGIKNLLCIYYTIANAQKTVDVCVPSLESITLTYCLVRVHEEAKVKMRVVIHNNSKNLFNLDFLAKNGIEVKLMTPVVRLGHEFLLVDAIGDFSDAVAVIGSLDYSTHNVNCNWDATVLTSESVVVRALQREFNRVWNCY